jgi:hypothetical protein
VVAVNGATPSNYAWQGTQGPETNQDDFHSSVFVVDSVLNGISTATLVKVVRAPYDAQGSAIPPGTVGPVGYVDVQPLVNQLDGYGNATPHATVYRLSYHRYQSGNGAVISDPVIGDIGKMVVADRDTSSVRATGKQSNPGSRRQFDKADGTYFGSPQGPAPSQWVRFTDGGIGISDKYGNEITMNSDGITITDKNGNMMVMSSSGIAFTSTTLTNTGEIVSGEGSGGTVTLGTHKHSDVTVGGGESGAPVAGT